MQLPQPLSRVVRSAPFVVPSRLMSDAPPDPHPLKTPARSLPLITPSKLISAGQAEAQPAGGGTLIPNASAAVHPQSQFSFGPKAPRYWAFVKKESEVAVETLVAAAFVARGSKEITGCTTTVPEITFGPRVIPAIGDEPAAANTLLLLAANTPRAFASVYAAEFTLL